MPYFIIMKFGAGDFDKITFYKSWKNIFMSTNINIYKLIVGDIGYFKIGSNNVGKDQKNCLKVLLSIQ